MYFANFLTLMAMMLALWAGDVRCAPPTTQQVQAAVTELKKDPLLNAERVTHTLDWIRSPSTAPRENLSWLAEMLRWLNESARLLVWVGGALIVIWLLWRLREFTALHAQRTTEGKAGPSTHVRDLDIRPQSLPSDIGTHAMRLWREGHTLEGLSLLYRGALSRLVHVHGTPVRPSSTEGECVGLARASLSPEACGYFASLVRVWQQAVYAARMPEEATMRTLCSEFGCMLDSTHSLSTSMAGTKA